MVLRSVLATVYVGYESGKELHFAPTPSDGIRASFRSPPPSRAARASMDLLKVFGVSPGPFSTASATLRTSAGFTSDHSRSSSSASAPPSRGCAHSMVSSSSNVRPIVGALLGGGIWTPPIKARSPHRKEEPEPLQSPGLLKTTALERSSGHSWGFSIVRARLPGSDCPAPSSRGCPQLALVD